MLDMINDLAARFVLYILEHFPPFAIGVGLTLACATAAKVIPTIWPAFLAEVCP